MVTAGDLFAGAAVGGAFGPVFDIFREVVEKTFEFNSTLQSVKSTVDSLASLIPKIVGHNNALGGNRAGEVEELRKTMVEGQNLIKELMEVNEWSCLKAHYTDQLDKLDESLTRHFQMLQVQVVVDVKETLGVAKDTSKDVKEGLGVAKDTSKDVKEGLALTKDTGKDVKETLIVAKDTGKEVKETLVVAKDTGKDVKETLIVAKDTGKEVKETLVVAKDTNGDVKENLALTKDTSEDVKENLALTKDTSGDVKDIARVQKETADRLKNVETLVVKILNIQEISIKSQPGEPKAWMSIEVPELPRFTVGLETHLKELKIKLLKDGGSMLVITAPGGSGKTTLAKIFYHDQQVKDKFTKKIFVTVSTKSYNTVVQELCQNLGFQESAFEKENGAFSWLKEFLKETSQPLLVILDDVCSASKSLLEKFNELCIQSNFSVLVTSRSSFRSFGYHYPLDALNHADAMTLFRHSAIRVDKGYNVSQNLQEKIVRRCKGCPLALEVVGKSLCGQFTESWLKKLSEWSEGASIFDTETDVLICLKTSLDALEEKDQNIKECFLDLGAFPEDQRIPAVALIDMWAELYGIDKDFISIQYLQELSSRSLANLVVTRKEKMEGDGYYSEHFVSQHDVLRDLAIFQAKLDPNKTRLILDKCGSKAPKKFKEQKQSSKEVDKSFQTRILSISSDEVVSIDMHKIQLSDVEVLVLNFQTKNYALPEFVADMESLKVLIVTNNGSLPAELSNFHLLDSLPNLKRIRLERISIPSITKNPIQLKSLKKISFFMCSIGQAFNDPSFQISNAFPNVEELNVDYCSDLVELSDDLTDLIELRKLSISHCHKLSALPEEIGKLIKLEVLRLKSCTDLVTLPASIKNFEKLQFLDISDCFSIKELPDDIGEISTLEKINMRNCSRVQDLPPSVKELKNLEEVICDEDREELWEFSELNIEIRVLKEVFSLDWLSKFES